MRTKTRLYLLTGFLGAGKTTFLTNVLNDLSGSKVAVIMNEFGRSELMEQSSKRTEWNL